MLELQLADCLLESGHRDMNRPAVNLHRFYLHQVFLIEVVEQGQKIMVLEDHPVGPLFLRRWYLGQSAGEKAEHSTIQPIVTGQEISDGIAQEILFYLHS